MDKKEKKVKARGKEYSEEEREGERAMEAVERESDREGMQAGRGAVRDDTEVKSMLLILDSGNGFVLVALR
jgi:hypothetical protein